MQRDKHAHGNDQGAGEEHTAQLHLFHERGLLSFGVRVGEPSLPLFPRVLGERAGPVLPGGAILAEHLLVQGMATALVPLHLRQQGAHQLERLWVLLPVVVACQIEPTEGLLPLVERTIQVLGGSTQPEDDLVPAPTLPFLGCPGVVLQRMCFPREAPKGGAGCHERGGDKRLLAKGSPGLPDLVQRYPQRRERRKIRKRSRRGILLLWLW